MSQDLRIVYEQVPDWEERLVQALVMLMREGQAIEAREAQVLVQSRPPQP